MTRRFGRYPTLIAIMLLAGSLMTAVACGEAAPVATPQVIIQTVVVEKIVEKPVEKIVKQTVVVEKPVEKIMKETVVVKETVAAVVQTVIVQQTVVAVQTATATAAPIPTATTPPATAPPPPTATPAPSPTRTPPATVSPTPTPDARSFIKVSTRIVGGRIQADFVNNFDRPVSFNFIGKGKDVAGVTVFTASSSDRVNWLLPGERYRFEWFITTGAVIEGQAQILSIVILEALGHLNDPTVRLLSNRRQETSAPIYVFRNDGIRRAEVSYICKTYGVDGNAEFTIGGGFSIEAGETLEHHVWDGVTGAVAEVMYVQTVTFVK